MTNQEPNKRKNIHTLINIGLIAFLVMVATIGMRGLTYPGYAHEFSGSGIDMTTEKVMICAIGQCLFI